MAKDEPLLTLTSNYSDPGPVQNTSLRDVVNFD